MKTKITILLLTLLLFNCRNYSSENYIKKENEAIQEIILQLIQYDEAMKVTDLGNKKLKLYLLNTLNNGIYTINVPQTALTTIEDLTVKQNKWIKEEKRKYKKEKKKFFPFLIGSIKERKLNHTFINSKLVIELVSEEIYKKKIANFDGTYGLLGISRIVFNRDFDTGYLSYGYFCGSSCAWSDNIEIKKIDGKWKITEKFSGGIAQRNFKNKTENWKWKSKPNKKMLTQTENYG